MTRIAALLFSVVFFALGAISHAQAPVEHFARLPAAAGLSISPDGTRIAFIAHDEERRLIIVESLDTGEQAAASADDLRILDTLWPDNDTVLATVSTVIGVDFVRGDVDLTALITFNADTLESRELIERRVASGINFNTARIAGRDRETGHLLMPLRDERGRMNLSVVNPATGSRSRTIARGGQNTQYWLADPVAERFVEVRYSRRENLFSIRMEGDGGERTIYEDETPLIMLSVVGFTSDGDLAVTETPFTPPYTRQIQRLYPETGALGEVVFRDEDYDFEDAIIDPHLGHLVGVTIEREHTQTIWFDEELARRQTALEGAIPGSVIQLVDWSADRQRFIFSTTTNAQPPIYFLMDFATSQARAIKLAYPELFEADLAAREILTYTARDGASIPAYLARPDGEGPHPFVVFPHGGPHARDTGGFDYLAHFLVDRGYGVIQPQFRGSAGFGGQWEIAGRGEWGTGLMQTDVIDAVTYLREEGFASKICIVGASYGGYSALAAAAFTPDLFDCAISINGVSDLPAFMDYVNDRSGTDSRSVRFWTQSISGSLSDPLSAAELARLSPAQNAEAVTIPVMLLHGQDDTVVPASQSRNMRQRLERAGADVEFVQQRGGDHWLWEYQTRLQVMSEMERFLSEHLAE
jgi:dipeptidyl aminopeptidase/acylaminoacyl peptidase